MTSTAKRVLALLLVCCLVCLPSRGQPYHTPAEILQIITDSKLTYEIATLEPRALDTVEVSQSLGHGLFLKTSPEGPLLTSYDSEYGSNEEYVTLLDQAEQAFADDSLRLARDLYLRVLDIVPDQSQLMTFIGQTYENEGDHDSAMEWYRKAVNANYFDYMARWFLADNLELAGQHEEALTEILLAHVMNRTNPRLQEALEAILSESNLRYRTLDFEPRYQLERLDETRVSVKYAMRPEWLAYALCKAAWRFEPGYRESMLEETQEHAMVAEEKECVFCALLAAESSGGSSGNPDLRAASTALEGGVFTEFLVYDVIMPEIPAVVFTLPRAFIESLPDYVLKFRTEEK